MSFLIKNADEASRGEEYGENVCMWKLSFILAVTENNHEAWCL